MSWEMSILKRLREIDPNDSNALLGSVEGVHSQLERFFPEMNWENLFRGSCDFDDGTVAFEIRGDPVEYVKVRLWSELAVKFLISFVHMNGWVLLDDSGEQLVMQEGELENVGTTQSQIVDNQSIVNANRRESRETLPRVKSRVPLSMVQPSWILDELELVALRDGEGTLDAFDEYSAAMWQNEHIRSLKCHPNASSEEVHTPNGSRFGAFLFSKSNPEIAEFFYDYLKRTSRDTAKYSNGMVVLKDGKTFDASECEWVERVNGRARKK